MYPGFRLDRLCRSKDGSSSPLRPLVLACGSVCRQNELRMHRGLGVKGQRQPLNRPQQCIVHLPQNQSRASALSVCCNGPLVTGLCILRVSCTCR